MFTKNRNNVLYVGSFEIPPKAFNERKLPLVKATLVNPPNVWNEARAFIIAEPSNKIGAIRESLFSLKEIVDKYGISVYILTSISKTIYPSKKYTNASAKHIHENFIRSIWYDYQINGDPQIYYPADIPRLAQDIYDFDPGPKLSDVKILPKNLKLLPQVKLLLRRAFGDCDNIYLRRLDGGNDAVNVFCVDALLGGSKAGPRPMPFFIKISDKKKIREELQNYDWFVEQYVPFYLRPNIDRTRCITVGNLSSMVGNFVEDAQSLRIVLRANTAPGILFSLFENSLKGFRLQPSELKNVKSMQLDAFIKDRSKAKNVSKRKMICRVARGMGLTQSPVKLETSLCHIVKNKSCEIAPHHGDLHSGNVMVRGKDAILIDFSAVKDAPFTADLAALEVSLVFGSDEFDQSNNFSSWKLFVDEIYEDSLNLKPPLTEKTPSHFSWLRKAVREIRHVTLGCDCLLEERKAILITYLIRFARLKIEKFDDKLLAEMAIKRHAYALVMAEKLINSLIISKTNAENNHARQ